MVLANLQIVSTETGLDFVSDLIRRFHNRQAVVGVIGLGYVGLPLVATFCQAGFASIRFDIDAGKVEVLAQGRSYIRHVPAARIQPIEPLVH